MHGARISWYGGSAGGLCQGSPQCGIIMLFLQDMFALLSEIY